MRIPRCQSRTVLVSFSTVPFIYGDNESFSEFFRLFQNANILHLKSIGGIYQKHCDVARLQGPMSPQRSVKFYVPGHSCPLAQPGRIDQHDFPVLELDHRVDGVPGRTWYFRNDGAGKSENGVRQRRFTDIRFPDQRHTNAGILRRASGASGSTAVRSSSISPVPVPLIELTGYTSPNPSA